MTDGEDLASHALRDAFRAGTSPIWRHVSGSTSRYSLLHAGREASTTGPVKCRPFWVPYLTGTDPNNWATYPWQPRPWDSTAVTNTTACYSSSTNCTTPSRLTWPEVWSSLRINWVAYQLYARGNCMSGLSGTNDQTCRNREYLQARGAIRGPNVYAAHGHHRHGHPR